MTQPAFFSDLRSHLGEHLALDLEKPLKIKDLDLEFTATGKIRTGWIEVQGTSTDGDLRQMRVRMTNDHWTKEKLPIHGASHEFLSAKQLFDRLDSMDWPETLVAVGNPKRISLRLLDAKHCLMVVRALETATVQADSGVLKQVEINMCD